MLGVWSWMKWNEYFCREITRFSHWWKMLSSFKMNSGINICNVVEHVTTLLSAPLFPSSQWMKETSVALLLLQCSQTPPSSRDVSGSSWGGPALAPLKGRSATLSVLRPQQARPLSGEMAKRFPGQRWKWMLPAVCTSKKFCTRITD